MKQMQFNSSIGPAQKITIRDLQTQLGTGVLSALTGNEALSVVGDKLSTVTGFEHLSQTPNVQRVVGAIAQRGTDTFKDYMSSANLGSASLYKELEAYAGAEGFSLQQSPGAEKSMKAVNIALNAQAQLQTEAAEAMFRTITIPYEYEQIDFVVRSAGLGTYVSGANAFQRASELRPIFGLLRTGEIFTNDSLRIYPVYPEQANDQARAKFVPEAEFAPYDVVYNPGDAYGREAHRSSMLVVPVKLENLLGLSQAPGQRPWTTTDEIEASAVSIDKVKINARFNGQDIVFFVNTATMSNNTFGVTTTGQTSDERGLSLVVKNLPASAVLDKDNNSAVALFDDMTALGYQPLLSFSLKGSLQRQTNEFELSSGSATITAVSAVSDKEGKPIPVNSIQEALVKTMALSFGGSVTGAHPRLNVNNISQGNFGYRLEVFDARKQYATRRREPISVKYPVTKEDVNQESLDAAIEHMSIAINNQCSKDAFTEAAKHLEYIKSINGQGVVSNQQGSNVLAGQHFVTATAVSRTLTLRDVISVTKNEDLFLAICAALINETSDMVAALETRSGIASIKEYGAINDMNWNLITHQNLARFFIKSGDIRTIGGWSRINVKATNFDSMIGQAYLVPADNSTGDNINPLTGVGINVVKENIVVQGNMHRDQQHYGVLLTVPSYRHWALNPVIGHLTVTDAAEFLTDDGLLASLTKLRIAAADADGLLINDPNSGAPVNPNP